MENFLNKTIQSGMLVLAIGLGVSVLAAPAHAVTIDFNSLEVPNSSLNYIPSGMYSEDGYTLVGSPMYYAGQNHSNQYAGSAGLHMRAGNALITLTKNNNQLFTLKSIELSVLRNG